MLRTNIQKQTLKILFEAAIDSKEIPEEKFLEIKNYIKILADEANNYKSAEMRMFKKIKLAVPSTPLTMSQECILDTQFLNNNTLLIYAGINNHAEMAAELLEAKASLNVANDDGDTALICAARHGYPGLVNQLLARKANIESFNCEKNTALDEAISFNQLTTVNVLLNYNAKINNPQKLYEFLFKSDPRDPDVVSSLEILCNNNASSPASVYLSKLKSLRNVMDRYDYEDINKTREMLLNSISTIPKVLTSIVTDYHHYSLSKLPFFKPEQIDHVLFKINNENFIEFSNLENRNDVNSIDIEIDLFNLLITLRQIGGEYLKKQTPFSDNKTAAEMLSQILGDIFPARYLSRYMEQKILESLDIIFNTTHSDLLKMTVLKTLMTYQSFSHVNYKERFSSLIDHSRFKHIDIQFEHFIYHLRGIGKDFLNSPYQDEQEAGQILCGLLMEAPNTALLNNREFLFEQIKLAFNNICKVSKSKRLFNYIEEAIFLCPWFETHEKESINEIINKAQKKEYPESKAFSL